MARAKKKTAVQEVDGALDASAFENPDAALTEGSEMQLQVLDGNDIEAPEAGGDAEVDPAADEARNRLKKVLQNQDDHFFDIARDMAYIANKKAWAQWGFKTFESFLDSEFSMAKRKGQYYVQVYNYFESSLRATLRDRHADYNHLMDVIKQEGWTKGRVLAREQIITPDNVQEVIVKVEECSYRELEEYCKLINAMNSGEDKDDDNTIKMEPMRFMLSPGQKADVESALDHAKLAMQKDATNSSALAWVATDYKSTNIAAVGKERPAVIAETLSKYERLCGITLIAIDDETQTVMYGKDNLERLSQ